MRVNAVATYAKTQSLDIENVVTRYAPIVKRIAYHLASRLPPSVQPGDLIQAGMIGLLEAARHYDSSRGASFVTYAGIRVRGAMLDEVRRNDWAPRSVHRKARDIAQAVRRVENRKGAGARDHEIAEALGVSLAEYHQTLQDVSGHRILSFEDLGVDEAANADSASDTGKDALDLLQARETKQELAAALNDLPERERLVMSLYYDEELNLREIGEVLGVTESRVCQIHTQALVRLKARMANGKNNGEPRRRP
jgi:RNA polymerase sigma factor FliA